MEEIGAQLAINEYKMLLPQVTGQRKSNSGFSGRAVANNLLPRGGKKYPKGDVVNHVTDKDPYSEYPNPYANTLKVYFSSMAKYHPNINTNPSSTVNLANKTLPSPPKGGGNGLRYLNIRNTKEHLQTNIQKNPTSESGERVASPGVTRRLSDCLELLSQTEGSPSQGKTFLTDLHHQEQRQQRGFEQVGISIENMFKRLHADDLSDKWLKVSCWIDQFFNDKDCFHVAAVCREGISSYYQRDLSHQRKHPNPTMTSIACAILEQCMSLLERLQPVLSPVCRAVWREIIGAIFLQPSSQRRDQHDDEISVPSLINTSVAEGVDLLSKKADTFMYMKPYYGLVRDVAHRIGQAEDEVEAAERRREKQSAALDRGMSFWQMEYRKLILKAWKMNINMRKKQTNLESTIATTEQTNQHLHKQIDLLGAEISKIEDSCEDRISELRDQITELQKTVSQLEEDHRNDAQQKCALHQKNHTITLEVEELMAKSAGLTNDNQRYQEILKETIVNCMEGSHWEVKLQQEFNSFIEPNTSEDGSEEDCGITEQKLLRWINNCATSASGSDTYCLTDFTNVIKQLDTYACVMHYMSPSHVSLENMEEVHGAVDVYEKAQLVMSLSSKFGIDFPVDIEDLINPSAVPQHLLFITSLFQRFADPAMAMSCSQPTLSGPISDSDIHPLWEEIPSTPDGWKKRLEQAWTRSTRWRGVGATSQNIAMESVVDKLAGRTQKVVTAQERVLRSEFCDAPAQSAAITCLLPKKDTDKAFQLSQVKDKLQNNFRALNKIFSYYSSSDSRSCDNEISADEVWKLITDAKLTKVVSRTALVNLFKKSNSQLGAPGQKETLGPQEYSQLLLHLASEMKAEGGLQGKLDYLLRKHVLPQCNWTDASEFRDRLYKTDIQRVLKTHREFAAQVFGWYIQQSSGLEQRGSNKPKMRMETFCDLVSDLHIVDSVLTHESVRQIFLRMQDANNPDTYLEFYEFLECLCALAAFKNPAPYLPLFKRIARFFEVWFVPTLSTPAIKRFHKSDF